MKIIEKNGEYNYRSFKIDDKVFTIVGSEVSPDSNAVMEMTDSFRSSDNKISTRKRQQIWDAQQAKDSKMVPVEDSKILFRNISKEETKRIQARRTDI